MNDYYRSIPLTALPSSWVTHIENLKRLSHLLVSTRLSDGFLFIFIDNSPLNPEFPYQIDYVKLGRKATFLPHALSNEVFTGYATTPWFLPLPSFLYSQAFLILCYTIQGHDHIITPVQLGRGVVTTYPLMKTTRVMCEWFFVKNHNLSRSLRRNGGTMKARPLR